MGDAKQKLTNLARDTRTPCIYGAECYQKNPFHHSKYRHPPSKKDESGAQRPSKRRKIEALKKEEKFTSSVSESDDDDDDDGNVNEDISDEDTDKIHLENVQTNEASNIPGTSDDDPGKTDIGDRNSEKTAPDDVQANEALGMSGENIIKAKEVTQMKRFFKIKNDVSDSEDEADLGEEDCENVKLEEGETKEEQSSDENSKEISAPAKANFDKKEFIKSKFLVDMPPDFYDFWEFCSKIQKANPLLALKDVGLILVGPYDVLAGKFDGAPEKDEQEYLVHWRYYFDVPELQTVLKGDDASGYHVGYFRDSPDEPPAFLASNRARSDGVFSEMGGNIFAAVSLYLENLKKTGDPFKKMQISRLASLIKAEADKLHFSLAAKTHSMRERNAKIVTRTFNKIGLVVPYNRKTQVGYRELALPDRELKKLLENLGAAVPEQRSGLLAKLQPVLTYASIAADECDFGTGVELGWDILCSGVESLNSTAANFLATAYRLLNREAFALIIEAHMKNRRRGSSLSIL